MNSEPLAESMPNFGIAVGGVMRAGGQGMKVNEAVEIPLPGHREILS